MWLRLDKPRKLLVERKAWLTPIRKMPHEILSLIFIEASRLNWKAPLVIQSVSRRWRDVVKDSPEAWTFIPLSKCSSKGRSVLILPFLERSHNRPLHISVRDDSLLGYMEVLARKIECFHVKTTVVLINRYLQCGHTFHRLESLKIETCYYDATTINNPPAWDMLLFPNLKVLVIDSSSPLLLSAISAAPEFPAIQHLTVTSLEPWMLLDILTKCATSLESAELVYEHWHFEGLDGEHEFHFPRLRYLRILDWSDQVRPRLRFSAATPNLQAYLNDGDLLNFNAIKVDTDNIILLHVLRTPDLSQYPRLVTLCFSREIGDQKEIIKATECLRDNASLCPDLTLIEHTADLTEEEAAKAKDALLARGEVNGHIIQLAWITPDVEEEWMQALRGVETVRFVNSMLVPLLTVRQCGDHMPCNSSI